MQLYQEKLNQIRAENSGEKEKKHIDEGLNFDYRNMSMQDLLKVSQSESQVQSSSAVSKDG